MEQSLSWEANSHPVSQEIPPTFKEPESLLSCPQETATSPLS
jgi:hypothetical protein